MATQVIWEVFNNIGLSSETHYSARDPAMQFMLNELNAAWLANPGSYWRVDAWQPQGDVRSSIRVGAGANSGTLADLSLTQRSLADVQA
jgi:hypothetical protein